MPKLKKIFTDVVREAIKDAYLAGLNKGYELGWQMGKTERTNRGFIIGGLEVNRQLNEIIKKADF